MMKVKRHKLNRLKRDYLQNVLAQNWAGMIDFKTAFDLDENHIVTGVGRAQLSQKSLNRDLTKIRLKQMKTDYLTILAGWALSYAEYQLICDAFSASECRVRLHIGIKDSVDLHWLEFDVLPKESR